MNFISNTTENQIFNALISRTPKFTVDSVQFIEKVIKGTEKERERKCKIRAKELTKLIENF